MVTVVCDVNVQSIDENPEKDGIFLTYYHGHFINHITAAQSIIYFICDERQEMSNPFAEHVRSCGDPNDGDTVVGDQYHFFVQTKYACKT